MAVYMILDITVNDMDRYQEYVRQVPAIIERHGGRYLVRGGATLVLEGSWEPERIVVLEFPDAESAQAFATDPDYAPLLAIRHEAATSNLIAVEGVE